MRLNVDQIAVQLLIEHTILFLLYTAELFDVIAECGLPGHTYADDTQVYISTPATDHVDAMDRLAACIERIRDWMADSHLKMNEEKTQINWLSTRQQLNKVTARTLTLPNATVEFSTTVKDLGLRWTVSSPWPTTLLHSADPASSTSGSSGR